MQLVVRNIFKQNERNDKYENKKTSEIDIKKISIVVLPVISGVYFWEKIIKPKLTNKLKQTPLKKLFFFKVLKKK